MSEYMEQVKFVSWFRKTYPDIKIYHTPNGEKRELRIALKLKNMGVMRGVWDLYVRSLNLWIEMKDVKDNDLTKEQKEWQEYCEQFGDKFIVGYGFEDAQKKVLDLFPKLL